LYSVRLDNPGNFWSKTGASFVG